MLPYLIVFFLSVLFTYLAQESDKNNKRLFFFVFSAFAILLPSLLAGFRDSGIGTDTEMYVDSVWKTINRIDSYEEFQRLYRQEKFDDIEYGYLLLNFIGSKFGTSVNIIYFLSNFLVILLVYCTAYDNKHRLSMAIVMTLFLFGYYNLYLNLVRQALALAVGLYCFKYVERRSWIKVIISFFIIKAFHNTGVFCVLFWGAYFLSSSKYRLKPLVLILLLGVAYGIFIYFDFIILYTIAIGILPKKFLYYLSGDTVDYTTIFVYHFLLSAIMFIVYLFHAKSQEEKDRLLSYGFLSLLGSILVLTAMVSMWSYRVAFYFSFICDIIFLPRALYLMNKKHKLESNLMLIITIGLVITVWYKYNISNNDNETYPYKSEILGIY